jgi:hypothetical protein
MPQSPFKTDTPHHLIAIVGQRAGYLQMASSQEGHQHSEVPSSLFLASQAWSAFLQTQEEIAKVYGLQFSEVVSHLHWHLYPRFVGDKWRGTDAFEKRNTPEAWRAWPLHWQAAVYQWAKRFDVALLDPDSQLQPCDALFPDYSGEAS